MSEKLPSHSSAYHEVQKDGASYLVNQDEYVHYRDQPVQMDVAPDDDDDDAFWENYATFGDVPAFPVAEKDELDDGEEAETEPTNEQAGIIADQADTMAEQVQAENPSTTEVIHDGEGLVIGEEAKSQLPDGTEVLSTKMQDGSQEVKIILNPEEATNNQPHHELTIRSIAGRHAISLDGRKLPIGMLPVAEQVIHELSHNPTALNSLREQVAPSQEPFVPAESDINMRLDESMIGRSAEKHMAEMDASFGEVGRLLQGEVNSQTLLYADKLLASVVQRLDSGFAGELALKQKAVWSEDSPVMVQLYRQYEAQKKQIHTVVRQARQQLRFAENSPLADGAESGEDLQKDVAKTLGLVTAARGEMKRVKDTAATMAREFMYDPIAARGSGDTHAVNSQTVAPYAVGGTSHAQQAPAPNRVTLSGGLHSVTERPAAGIQPQTVGSYSLGTSSNRNHQKIAA